MRRNRFNFYIFLKISLQAIAFIICSALYAQETEPAFADTVFRKADIFVLTNRQAVTSNTGISFTNNVNEHQSLTFVRVYASVKDSLKITQLDSTAFLSEILAIKKQDWVLYVHGDSKTFEQAVIRGLAIQNTYNLRVIVFSWPSKESDLNGVENFKNSCQNAGKSLKHFNSVLGIMSVIRNSNSDFLNENNLSLFLHSLGNQYLEWMVKGQMLNELPSQIFDNVIINSAAVEQKQHKEWVEQLHFQKHIFIINNKHDFTLAGLRLFTNRGKQLGEKAEFPFADNAVYLNFSKSVGFRFPTRTTHSYYIGIVPEGNRNVRQCYFEILHGMIPDLDDKTRFKKSAEVLGYIIVR